MPRDLMCTKCDYKWTYRGNRKCTATCPDCNLHIDIELAVLRRVAHEVRTAAPTDPSLASASLLSLRDVPGAAPA
jgi:hypothetical protein